MRERFTLSLLVVAALASVGLAQNFECQGPPCQYAFPVPKGAAGDCEGVSWNGLGISTVDVDNGCGFPCFGNQYLRMVANGPVMAPPCAPPPVLGPMANEIYVRVPPGATSVSLCWDFYPCELPMSPFNDGMMIDVLGPNCNQLAVLAYADTFKPYGPCIDAGIAVCASNCVGIDLPAIGPILVGGPETIVAAPLPANAAFIRIAVWNGTDNNVPSHGVVDGISFMNAPAACPGTQTTFGDDIAGIGTINGLVSPGTLHTVPVGGFFGFTTLSPGGTFNFRTLYVIGSGYACAAGAPPAAIPGQVCVNAATAVVMAGGPTPPFGFALVLPPAPGFIVTYGPNPGLAGLCLKVQGLVVSPLAGNGIFATTNCHTYSFM